MGAELQLAITADLHWGHGGRGEEATRLLASFLHTQTPDVLILAGDIGTDYFFGECLQLFTDLPCRKALVPGNHDLWVRPEDRRDSLYVYEEDLAEMCRRYGFHYLDQGPLLLPEAGLGVVGSINWYDYSWSREKLQRDFPGEETRLLSKQFTRGRHNDVNFVRWPLDDERFTARVVDTFAQQLRQVLTQVERVIVVTHHPPMRCISFPEKQPPLTLDDLLWEAFGGNRAMEDLLACHAERIAFAFCGHTHRARQGNWHGIRGYNVGGDYHFKRLLWLNWPSGIVLEHQLGDADPSRARSAAD
ncbi:MAG TPA: metallophosphoesterase [Gemmataceae bacterium]|nr:metallophosphoesterase [Gemmataceae bacterium]